MAGAAGGSGFVGACLVRQPILTRLGLLFHALAVPAAAGLIADPQTLGGDPAWLKPPTPEIEQERQVAIVMDGDHFLGLITRIDLLNYLRRRVQ